MTPHILSYFGKAQAPRKKEPQYLAYINKNSCTSCGSCATVCPVDCIFETDGPPSDSHHQIDLSRCIGCQQCYRIPSESTGPWTMEICPWNAIDMTKNPNFVEKGAGQWAMALEPYFAGAEGAPNFRKLEEIGYQLYLNRTMYLKKGHEYQSHMGLLTKDVWSYGEGNFSICTLADSTGEIDCYACTEKGDELIDFLFRDYQQMFLD
jgi:ferredoxin